MQRRERAINQEQKSKENNRKIDQRVKLMAVTEGNWHKLIKKFGPFYYSLVFLFIL